MLFSTFVVIQQALTSVCLLLTLNIPGDWSINWLTHVQRTWMQVMTFIAHGWQTVLKRGVVRVTWPIFCFYARNHVSGMAEAIESPNFVCGYNMLGITAVLEVGRYETVCLAFLTILCWNNALKYRTLAYNVTSDHAASITVLRLATATSLHRCITVTS